MSIQEANKLLEDYCKKTGAKLGENMTDDQRIKLATDVSEFQKKWNNMNRRQKRHVLGNKNKQSTRIKNIMKVQQIKDVIIKRYSKHLKQKMKDAEKAEVQP